MFYKINIKKDIIAKKLLKLLKKLYRIYLLSAIKINLTLDKRIMINLK